MNLSLKLTQRPTIEPLAEASIDWLKIHEHDDFKMIGLCNRHVQIDNTGRDWYGMPLLVDALAAPVQGIPYVSAFETQAERELNDLLWQLEYLSRRGESPVERALYTNYCNHRQTGSEALSPEAWFERQVQQRIDAGIYPSVRLAAMFIQHESDEEYARKEKEADDAGLRFSSNLEKFGGLDLVGQVIFGLEGLIKSVRQSIYYDKLNREHVSEQQRSRTIRQAHSQAHWKPIDEAREQQRLDRLRLRRTNPEALTPVEVIQSTLFQEVA
jgi:hypothetical protein